MILRYIAKMILLALGAFPSGCALHYCDAGTETEHVFGFGNTRMKAGTPNEGLQAVVHGITKWEIPVYDCLSAALDAPGP